MGIFNKQEKTAAQTVVEEVLAVRKNEKALIIANPETAVIAQDLFTALLEANAKPVLMYQTKKSSMDNAEDAVIGALKSEPDVVLSISECKLGKDAQAVAKPYAGADGTQYDSIFDYLLEGKKTMRGVWTPGLTQDMFDRTVKIDYKLLGERCKKICERYVNAVSVHVTSPNGTDVTVPVTGRTALVDNGDFTQPGSGGNVPAGEVFISPVVGNGNTLVSDAAKKVSSVKDAIANGKMLKTEVQQEEKPEGTEGTIVFDGSMTFSDGDALLKTPITVNVVRGFVTDITGGEEARRLLKDIIAAEKESLAMELSGKLPAGQGAVYARNARNIGELGIGLNPSANITGNMLEDEKAFRTCHFAIGANYDNDAPSLIHFDGIVRNPTIEIFYADGSSYTLLKDGELQLD